jgi:hypothetical protein
MKRALLASSVAMMSLVAIASGPWPPDAMTDFVDFELPGRDGQPVSSSAIRDDRAMVVAYGSPWCGYSHRQVTELAKLRQDFAAQDLVLVQVVVGGQAGDMAEPEVEGSVMLVGDPKASHAARIGLEGVPVVQVVDPQGGVVWEKNFTPRAWLRDRVKVALTALDRPLAEESVAGRAQTACPVTGESFDHKVFSDLPLDGPARAVESEQVVEIHRVYLANSDAKNDFETATDRYLKAMAAQSVTPEKVWIVRRPGSTSRQELCRPCGSIKGSAEFLKFWAQPRASCLDCRRMLGSPGCCLSASELAGKALCPDCGYPKDDAACCELGSRELCPTCGLERTSKGCCHIL